MIVSIFIPPRLRCHLPSILLMICLDAAMCVAQTGKPTGVIRGTVTDNQGHTLSTALVALVAEGSNANLRTVTTDADGHYNFADIAYGDYSLTVTLNGFSSSKAFPLSLTSANAVVDVTLSPHDEVGALRSGSVNGAHEGKLSFHPSGAQGTTAPSGYSAGATAENNSRVMEHVTELDNGDSALIASGEAIPGCDQKSDLLKNSQQAPSDFQANHRLGLFYLAHHDYRQSIRSLEMAAQIEPSNFENSRDLAVAYLGAKQSSDAIGLSEKLVALRANEPALYLLLGRAYLASGNPEKAIEEYQKAASMDDGEQNQFACGIGLVEAGAADEAGGVFSAATEVHPASARLWTGLGIARALEQQKTSAIRSLLKAAELDPGYLPAYAFLANLSGTSEGSDLQIRERLAALVVSSPERAESHYDYALALWKEALRKHASQQDMEIEAQLKLAVQKDPTLAAAHLLLGVIYADVNDYSRAVPELEDAARLEPGNAETHYRLAQAYRRNQQTTLADQELKKFVAMHGRLDGGQLTTVDFRPLTRQQTDSADVGEPCQQPNR
jgi:tetratricopeptide (TPR) repeat protein